MFLLIKPTLNEVYFTYFFFTQHLTISIGIDILSYSSFLRRHCGVLSIHFRKKFKRVSPQELWFYGYMWLDRGVL